MGYSKKITITAPSLPWRDSANNQLKNVADHTVDVDYIGIVPCFLLDF